MWHLGMLFRGGPSSAGLMTGLCDLWGLSQYISYSKVLWFQNTHLYQPVKCLTPLLSRNFTLPFLGDCTALAQTDLLELFMWCPVLQRGNHAGHAGSCHACPWASSSTELSTNCFYWQENKGDEVWSYCRVHKLTVDQCPKALSENFQPSLKHQQCKSSVLESFKIWMPAAFLLAVCNFKGLFLH